MKIKIKITTEQYGTELGDLCDPTYRYACSEDNGDDAHEILFADEILLKFTVDEISPLLKKDFFNALDQYLNKKFEREQPDQWDNESYQAIIERIRIRTVARSSQFYVGAVIGLFSPQLCSDSAGIIRNSLDKHDCLNASSTSNGARAAAISNTFNKSV